MDIQSETIPREEYLAIEQAMQTLSSAPAPMDTNSISSSSNNAASAYEEVDMDWLLAAEQAMSQLAPAAAGAKPSRVFVGMELENNVRADRGGAPLSSAAKRRKRVPPQKFSVRALGATMELIRVDTFRVIFSRGQLEPCLRDALMQVNGSYFDSKLQSFCFPVKSYKTLVYRLKNNFNGIVVYELSEAIKRRFIPPVHTLPLVDVSLDHLPAALLSALRPFQRDGLVFAAARGGRALIADEMGLGKTIQAIACALYYRNEWPFLVVAPAAICDGWVDALQRWAALESHQINLVKSAKGANLDAGDCVLMSFALAANMSQQVMRKRFSVVIIDESHKLKSFASKRTKALTPVCRFARRLIMLSGTPALSRPSELFTQLTCLNRQLFPNWKEFATRYCDPQRTRFGSGWTYSGASNKLELYTLLTATVMIRRRKADVLGALPLKVREQVSIQLDQRAMQALKRKARDMRIAAEEHGKQSLTREQDQEVRKVKRGLYLQYYQWTGTLKAPAVCQYVLEQLRADPSLKVLVFAHHRRVMDALCQAVEAEDLQYIRIDGKTAMRTRNSLVQTYQTDERVRVALLSIQAAGVGYTLTAATMVVFAELTFNPGDLHQAEDRAHRYGQTRSVYVKYLVAKDTIDEKIWMALDAKVQTLSTTLNGSQRNMSMDKVQVDGVVQDDQLIDDFFAIHEEEGEDEAIDEEEDDDDDDSLELSDILTRSRARRSAGRTSALQAFAFNNN